VLKENTLRKEARLTKTANFQQVFKHAKKFRYQGMSMFVRKNELTWSRLGICIPKKQVPQANQRNRIRRVIREYFRIRKNELITPIDMVFCAYRAVNELNNLEIRACLDFLWQKLIVFYKKV
jgi:ribonuclease P protein component